jgi:hypothetical protein
MEAGKSSCGLDHLSPNFWHFKMMNTEKLLTMIDHSSEAVALSHVLRTKMGIAVLHHNVQPARFRKLLIKPISATLSDDNNGKKCAACNRYKT